MSQDRYDRFRRLQRLGDDGLNCLANARIAIVGIGVLGCYAADLLVRLGVKYLRIIDRDILQPSDLGHQILYDEEAVKQELPKVKAAKNRLKAVNSSVEIEPVFADINPGNILSHLRGVDVILEGLDNVAARFLLNDAALDLNIPWVFCSAAGTSGMVMGIPAGGAPCFRCIVQDYPSPGSTPSCDTVGIWSPAAHWAAGQAVWLSIHGLMNQWQDWQILYTLEEFPAEIKTAKAERHPACPACDGEKREFLKGDKYPKAFLLCGRDEVTILAGSTRIPDKEEIIKKWEGSGELETTPYFLRWINKAHEIFLFDDGRVLIRGVKSVEEARRLWGRTFSQWM